MRLTLPHDDIVVALADIGSANAQKMKAKYSVSSSQRIIAENWFVKKQFRCDLECLAAIAALSGATSGQAVAVEDALVRAMLFMHERGGTSDGLQEEDVRAVVRALYTKAGALGSKWPETKQHKFINKHGAQKKAYAKTKGKEKMTAFDVTADEDLGQDAAEAARPGLKMDEVDELAWRLGKASVPDNKMLESDSEDEEDEVRKPGRVRRT